MISEKEIAASVLRLTRTGLIHKELIKKNARVSSEALEAALRQFSKMGFISLQKSWVEVSLNQRVNLAVHAVKLGCDYEQICKLLSWMEFESIAVQAFEENQFWVLKNFHFQLQGKRWEIDVLGCREPLVVCVDCKHWQHGWSRGAIIKAVEAQTERTHAFADALPSHYQKARLATWKRAIIIPLILSLVPGTFKFHNNVPIVPVLQLPSFINELPLEVTSLTRFPKNQFRFDKKLTSYCE